jgi:hypothetical protein
MTKDADFNRVQRTAGRRSVVAILANVPVVAVLWWGLANARLEGLDRWLLVSLCACLIVFEGWLAFWVFGALVKYTNRRKESQR